MCCANVQKETSFSTADHSITRVCVCVWMWYVNAFEKCEFVSDCIPMSLFYYNGWMQTLSYIYNKVPECLLQFQQDFFSLYCKYIHCFKVSTQHKRKHILNKYSISLAQKNCFYQKLSSSFMNSPSISSDVNISTFFHVTFSFLMKLGGNFWKKSIFFGPY